MSGKQSCVTCGGTGWQWLMRSWFLQDGYYRTRCGICSGSGVSGYRGDPKFSRWQAARRAECSPAAKTEGGAG